MVFHAKSPFGLKHLGLEGSLGEGGGGHGLPEPISRDRKDDTWLWRAHRMQYKESYARGMRGTQFNLVVGGVYPQHAFLLEQSKRLLPVNRPSTGNSTISWDLQFQWTKHHNSRGFR